VKLPCIALTAPARGGRGDNRKERGEDHAEADFLALHVAAAETEGMHQRVTGSFCPIGDADADDEQSAHGRKDRPALTLVPDHAAKRWSILRRWQRSPPSGSGWRSHPGSRTDGGVGIEEAAAVCAEHLDGKLRGNRADSDRLLGIFQASWQ